MKGSINENISIVQELAHCIHLSKAKYPVVIIKIDLSKAFDTSKKDAIILALRIINFPRKFIRWVKACITSLT